MSEKSSNIDIFGLLSDNVEKEEKSDKRKQREELLASTGVEELFPEGSIEINKHTCEGVQCKFCIDACPTKALYWKSGEVGIIEELCVYCGACVLSCMVDDCIKVTRKREDGTEEKFSKSRDVIIQENCINTEKRLQRVKDVFPNSEEYCKKYLP